MNVQLKEYLEPITAEEKRILGGDKEIQKEIYTTGSEFTIDSEKMLEKGRLIDIRTHTRFIDFPKHKHNYIEIMYMCEGNSTHIVNDGNRIVLEKGDLLFLNQFSSHQIMPARQEDIGINFIVLPEFFDQVLPMVNKENALSNFLVTTLRKNTDRPSYIHYKVSDVLPIQNLVENLIWSLLNKPVNHKAIDQTTMGLLFMQLVNHTDKIEENTPNQYEHVFVMKVLSYIEENYKNARLLELATQMNQSPSAMSKQIKLHTGKTFKELLQEKRLQQAEHLLLETLLPITDIIYMVGYDNTSYFHRVFRAKHNVSPKNFRDSKGN